MKNFFLFIFLLASTCIYAQEQDRVFKNLNLSYFEKTLSPQMGYDTIISKYGQPHINTGSGIYILIYNLTDSASLIIGCDNKRILYARSCDKNGVKHDLIQMPTCEQNKTKQKIKKPKRKNKLCLNHCMRKTLS